MALAASTVLVAWFSGRAAAKHREDLREITNFAINVSRVYSNEFMAIAIKSRIPEVDAAILEIQETHGMDRARAAMKYAEQAATDARSSLRQPVTSGATHG